MRTRTKVLVWFGGSLGAASLAIVALHLAPVRGLLGMSPLGRGGASAACPFGYGDPPAATVPRAARAIPSSPRPALGFVLDGSGPADVALWARAHGIPCTPQSRGSVIECENVPARLVPGELAATTLWFRFSGLALTSIQTVRRSADAARVASAFDASRQALGAAIGTPTVTGGTASAEALSRGALQQAVVEYHRPGYRAVVRATNLGDGFVLTESFAAI